MNSREAAARVLDERATIVAGNLSQPASLAIGLTGTKRMLLLSPISESMAQYQIALIGGRHGPGPVGTADA